MAHQYSDRIGQRGSSLIEVLVALGVLSIGMLGISALSLTTLKTNRDALLRTRAVVLASDLADRIRANPTAAASYLGSPLGAGTNNSCMQQEAGTLPSECTPQQLAADDIFHWNNALGSSFGGLPDGAGTVQQIVVGTPASYRITVQWTQHGETPANGVAQPASVTLEFQL